MNPLRRLPKNVRSWLWARSSDAEMSILHLICSLPIHIFRIWAFKAFGAKIAEDVVLYHGLDARQVRGLSIGARSKIGNDAVLDARGSLHIGQDVNLSSEVHIWTGQHDWMSPTFDYQSAPVTIGDRAWLSARVTILPGVEIGEGSVVAAGAVVSTSVPPFSLVAGVPAKVIGERPDTLTYSLGPRKRKAWWW